MTRNYSGKKLQESLIKFKEAWFQKKKIQNRVPTFQDKLIKIHLELIFQHENEIPWDKGVHEVTLKLSEFIGIEHSQQFITQVINWDNGRFVDFIQRKVVKLPTNISDNLSFIRGDDRDLNFKASAGLFHSFKWKNQVVFKTAFDLAIYQMLLWELQPKTIIEIGSGNGGSAIWLADMNTAQGLDTTIYSLDLNPPNISYPNVHFIEGDCFKIEESFPADLLTNLAHPILIIEDAHVNILNVLNHFHPFLESGDYLVVEDSERKQKLIGQFLKGKINEYSVDTLYCDYFGRNVTCSIDSILRKT